LPIAQSAAEFHPSIVRWTYDVPPLPGVTAHMRFVFPGSPTARRRLTKPLPALPGFSLADVVKGSDENHTKPKLRVMK
jgi:hypothetical protein